MLRGHVARKNIYSDDFPRSSEKRGRAHNPWVHPGDKERSKKGGDGYTRIEPPNLMDIKPEFRGVPQEHMQKLIETAEIMQGVGVGSYRASFRIDVLSPG